MTFRAPLVWRQSDRPRQQHDVTGPNLSIQTQPPAPRPFAQYDWPNPARLYSRDSGFTVNGQSGAPFRQLDWPNSQRLYADASGFIGNAITQPIVAGVPFSQTDWPSARAAGRDNGFIGQNLLQTTLAPPVVAMPFSLADWPNPPFQIRNQDFVYPYPTSLLPPGPTPTPDAPTNGGVPGRVQLMSPPRGRTREDEPRESYQPPVESTNDATAEYQRRSAKLSRALVRLRAEQTALRAAIAELEAQNTARAEHELLLQRQALQYAALQEAIVLEEITVIDVAFVAVVALTLH